MTQLPLVLGDLSSQWHSFWTRVAAACIKSTCCNNEACRKQLQ